MAKKSLEELIGQALDNIEHDRQVTEEMLILLEQELVMMKGKG